MWDVMDSLRQECLAHLECGNALESPLPPTNHKIWGSPYSRSAPGETPAPGVCVSLSALYEQGVSDWQEGEGGRRGGEEEDRRRQSGREAGRPASLEESPNQLKIAREIIPTPSQNRKQPPRPTKAQRGVGFEERWPWATPPPTRKTIPLQTLSPQLASPSRDRLFAEGQAG